MSARRCFILTAAALPGCVNLGPAVITHGRPQYAEAIARTTDQETLTSIVRMRYGESVAMLAVTSVTANIRFTANAQAQAGIGPDSSFAGNLVPLAGGIAYEENPTITYAPVEGPKFFKEYLSPNPLEAVVLAASSSRRPQVVLSLLLERVNGLWNPTSAAARPGDARFTRAIELMALLRSRGELAWGETSAPGDHAVVLIPGSTEMRELIELLGVDVPAHDGTRFVIPLRLSSLDVSRTAISVATRSVYDLLQIAAAGVEVPPEDLAAGIALPAEAPGSWGPGESRPPILVRWSSGRPSRAAVEVRHGNGWFYIDAADHESKVAFNLVQALVTARAHGSINDGSAPLLTVPLTR